MLMIDYDPKNWVSVVARSHGTIAPRLVVRVGIAAALGLVAALLSMRGFKMSATAHTLIGVALGLLLVFRTNASYERYWEGRKLLGVMVTRSRDLARQVTSFPHGDLPDVQPAVADVCRYLNAFFKLGTQSLRGERDLAALGDLLTAAERNVLRSHAGRAPMMTSLMSARIAELARAGALEPHHVMLIDANITALQDAFGGCERIVRTPVPFAYAQHIKLALLLYTATVPFAIADTTRWLTPIASAFIAYALIGIDEIGVEIEEPFGHDPNDLPIDKIAQAIADGVEDISGASVMARRLTATGDTSVEVPAVVRQSRLAAELL
ncbi:hypothetical protein Cs7R123_46590 [Catellatospora sp. TT07R-123]|nr:hypothetical protein Cs7R123_46590 [Catellatospora sp. TT07R-123]